MVFDERALQLLRPALLDARSADAAKLRHCAVGDADGFADVHVFAMRAAWAGAAAARSSNLFVTESSLGKNGVLSDLGTVLEIVTNAPGWSFGVGMDYSKHAHGNALISDDVHTTELLVLVSFTERRVIANVAREQALLRGEQLLVDSELEEDLQHVQQMLPAPAHLSRAHLTAMAADTLDACNAAGIVTCDNHSGGSSVQFGWHARIQGEKVGNAPVVLRGGGAFWPVRLRKRDMRDGTAETAQLLSSVAPFLGDVAAAIASCLPSYLEKLKLLHMDFDTGAYPPPQQQCPHGGHHLPFMELVVRMKGVRGGCVSEMLHAMSSVVGLHEDSSDLEVGFITYVPVLRTEPPVSSSDIKLVFDAVRSQCLALRLRGGARGDWAGALSSAERTARSRENKRRAAAGQPRLPRGAWDADFGPGEALEATAAERTARAEQQQPSSSAPGSSAAHAALGSAPGSSAAHAALGSAPGSSAAHAALGSAPGSSSAYNLRRR
jgi:hypothetical protein